MTLPREPEFRKRLEAYQRLILPLGSLLFVAVLGLVIWYEVSELSSAHWLWPAALGALVGAIFWYLYSFLPARFGLRCTACRRSLVRARRAEDALDRGCCPWCEAPVWQTE